MRVSVLLIFSSFLGGFFPQLEFLVEDSQVEATEKVLFASRVTVSPHCMP